MNLTNISCDHIQNKHYPCFKSLSDLALESVDIVNHYVMPLINIFSIVANIANLIVFSNRKLRKDGIGQLMFVVSISDFIYSFACIPLFVTRCGAFCSFRYSYWTKTLELN